jgi:hypothetical protein
LSGDTLHFGGIDDLRAARGDLLAMGALLAVSDAAPPNGPIDVRCVVGSTETHGRVRVLIERAQPGTVVVQSCKKGDWGPIVDEIERQEVARSESMSTSIPRTATDPALRQITFTLPMKGSLTNPTTPQGVLTLPLHRLVGEADLRVASVPLLLRWLRTMRGVHRVDLSVGGGPSHSMYIVDGREVRSSAQLTSLGKTLAAPALTYEVTALPRAPNFSHTGRTLHLIVEVVRGMLAGFDTDDIAAAFTHTNDARLVRAVGSVADTLGFQGAHARFVKASLQGDDTVRAVLRSPAGARTVWDVLVCLELFAGLSFMAGEGRALSQSSMPGVGAAPNRPDILDKDLYSVLGLHWSCAPSEVGDAYQRTRRDFGVGGARRPATHKIADEVMAKVEEAYRTLSNAETRRAYRIKTFNIMWPQQATLLVQQAKLAIYRSDVGAARILLNAAQDMSPTEEAAYLLEVLSRS